MKTSLDAELQSVLCSMQAELNELLSETGLLLQRYLFLQYRKKLGFSLPYRPRRLRLSPVHRSERLGPLIVVAMDTYMSVGRCSLLKCVRKVATALQLSEDEVLQLWQYRTQVQSLV